MLGLGFWVRFRRPLYADDTMGLEWLVVKVTPNESTITQLESVQ